MADQCDPSILTLVQKYLDVLRERNIDFESVWLFGQEIMKTGIKIA